MTVAHESIPASEKNNAESGVETRVIDPIEIGDMAPASGESNKVTSVRTLTQPRPAASSPGHPQGAAQENERSESGIPLGVYFNGKDGLATSFVLPGSDVVQKLELPGGLVKHEPHLAEGKPLTQKALIELSTGRIRNIGLRDGTMLAPPRSPVPYSSAN